MSLPITKSRMIYKVVVLGRDISLQTGFICRASGNNVSTQLYRTLGVSLGVAKSESREDTSIVLQLWALPQSERLTGLTASFTKGHRAAIVIVRPNDIVTISELLKSFSIESQSNIVIVVVRSVDDADVDLKSLNTILEDFTIHHVEHVDDVVDILADQLVSRRVTNPQPIIAILDDTNCPIFETREIRKIESLCSDSDINEIRSIILDQGL